MSHKHLSDKVAIVCYIALDTVFAGIGMGVPIFNILFGFLFGSYIANKFIATEKNTKSIYQKIFKATWWSAGYTFLLMAVIWLPHLSKLFDENYDIANFGHPMILFEPTASFIGWLVLMVIISPFLQVLTTIFASFVTIKNQTKEA